MEMLDNAEPTSRKEIFDYLRNVQKQTEVKARLSGINTWVLYGAIGFIVWTLLDPSKFKISEYVFNFSVFICELIVIFIYLLKAWNVGPRENDLRYRPAWMASQTNLSKHWTAKFILYAIPFIISGISWGFQPSSIIIPLIMVGLIVSELFEKTDYEDAKFLTPATKERWMASATFTILIGLIVYDNFKLFAPLKSLVGVVDLKIMMLIIVLYFLLLLLNNRGIADNSDAWSYSLEKKLLLGLCTSSEAILIIESHELGARVLKVIESKRIGLVNKAELATQTVAEMSIKILDINSISRQYVHERAAQFSKFADPVERNLQEFEKALEQFKKFGHALKGKNKFLNDNRISQLIEGIEKDINEFHGQLKNNTRIFNRIKSELLG